MVKELVAQIAHHALPDVGHQVGRKIRSEAFEEIDDEDGGTPRAQRDADAEKERNVRPGTEHPVHQRLDEGNESCRRRGVEQHGRDGRGKASLVRACVGEQPRESAHSVNRYFTRTHSATKPSSQVIFFPSS